MASPAETQTPPPARRRRWMWWVGAMLLFPVVLLLTVPVWLPWVVVPVLETYGVTMTSYDRHGMRSLELRGVRFEKDTVRFEAQQLDIQLPHRWLLDRYSDGSTNGPPQAALTGWRVEIIQGDRPEEPRGTNSLASVLDVASSVAQDLRPWLREISAADGVVVLGGREFLVERIDVDRSGVTARLGESAGLPDASVTVSIPRPAVLELQSSIPGWAASVDLELSGGAGGWGVAGWVNWIENKASLSGEISGDGWMPASLSLAGTNWVVDADTIGLDGYDALTGAFDVGWTNAYYVFRAAGEAFPSFDNALLPDRIVVNVAGQGTMESLAVETLNVSTPALFAQLSNPLAVDFSGRMLVPETTLSVSANFIPEDLLPFTGRLEGTLTARPDADEFVNADFNLQVNQFEGFGLNLDVLDLDGALHWPMMLVSNCSFTFPDAGSFVMAGGLDLIDQETEDFSWSFTGTVPTNLIPAELTLGEVRAGGTFNGVWPSLEHTSTATIDGVAWSGMGVETLSFTGVGNTASTNQISLVAGRGPASVSVGAMVDVSGIADSRVRGELRQVGLQLNESTTVDLVASAPFEFSHPPAVDASEPAPLQFQLSRVELVGGDRRLVLRTDLNWPDSGSVELAASHLGTADLAAFALGDLPELNLREARVNADWDAGPVTFHSRWVGDYRLDETDIIGWELEAVGGAQGIEVAPSQVRFNDQPVLVLEGTLPAVVEWLDRKAVVNWVESDDFQFSLVSEPAAAFLAEMEERFQLRVREPRVRIDAKGNLEDFQGSLRLDVASLQPLMLTNVPAPLTVVTDLSLQATASHESLRIEQGGFTVANGRSGFSGVLPIQAATWEEWFESLRQLDWRDATGSFRIPAVPIAGLNEITGEFLRPMGQVAMDVRLEGGRLNGLLSVTNVSTRAIEPFGSIRDFEGSVAFDHQQAELREVRATINGEQVRAGGEVSWDESGLAVVDVSLFATNITLVRTVDLFLRGDLDLHVRSDGVAAPRVEGEVSLHSSLLFQDISNLLQVNLDQPTTRPPFFSFPQEPFADWELDVRVRGQEFLRVLSPVFKGRVSTGLQLGGTLKEPTAVGEVSIESGQILFPFGSLDVQRGSVQLTREDPNRPRVDFRGQGMNFGYNVSIDVTGQADAPNIIFNSVPPLTTREIMLMLTAGEIPSGDYSFTDVDKASKLGYFLGKELINQLLGMDRGEDKLLFRTGEYVTDDGQLTYRIEYKLINWLAVFGEYTRFRDYNGGLKFNIYSR